MHRARFIAWMLPGLLAAPGVQAQQGDGARVAITTHVWKPAKVAADDGRLAQLKLPDGFTASVFARNLKNARVVAVAPNGDVYVTRRDQGDVLLLRDANGDGKADGEPVPVAHRSGTHGIAIHDGQLYLITVKEVFAGPIAADGTVGALRLLIGDLPDAGQHANRTIAFGPDGMLYISVGSTCNDCNESNPENATLLRASADGKSRIIFASGLRNTIGFDWQPRTGELWGFDHGIDFLGDDQQPEELNHLVLGHKYGWPHVYGKGDLYPQSTPPGGITKEEWKATSDPMALGYTAHAAPMQMVFYRGGGFPKEYVGDAFATMRGSWNREPASGYEIVRVHFDGGQPRSIEPFVSGFLSDGGQTHFARPMGLAVARDGSLLMADDANGVLYRIAYRGNAEPKTAKEIEPPAQAMTAQASKGVGVPLALERAGKRDAPLGVTSPTIRGDIPKQHSDYADGVSPGLAWRAVPKAQSYAVIAEDPDAKPITPFVHWLAWNIPADRTSLPEGLQEQPRLTEPEGLMQGRTSRGSVGYFGPKPPVGDPPHHYHFQVFALDTKLDVPAGSDRDQLLAAMQGHVIGSGELVGTYAQTVAPPK